MAKEIVWIWDVVLDVIAYHVFDAMNGYVMPLEDFVIKKDFYDLVLGISALEHVKEEECFYQLLNSIKNGVRQDGMYDGWEIIRHTIKFQEYDIPRENMVHLTSNVVTWVARRL